MVALIDSPYTGGGGAEVLAIQLLRGLDPERFRRTYCVSRWTLAGLDPAAIPAETESLAREGIELLVLDRRSRWDLASWRPLLALLRSGEVDVLHAHKFGSNVWGAVLATLARRPVFVAHEHTWSFQGRRLRRLIDRHVIARACDRFLAVSSEDRRRMIAIERIPAELIEVVPNGIAPSPAPRGSDVRAELGVAPGAPLVGTVAILRPQKSLHLLIEAAGELRGRHPGLRVLIVGHGPEEDALRELIARLGLESTVSLVGFRADVPDLLASLDVAVSCSAFEGSPLAVLEYMAAGAPIVATRVGGVPDLVADGESALLVPPGDSGELATGIDRLLTDRALAERLGATARARQREEFTLERMAQRVADVYERALVGRQHA